MPETKPRYHGECFSGFADPRSQAALRGPRFFNSFEFWFRQGLGLCFQGLEFTASLSGPRGSGFRRLRALGLFRAEELRRLRVVLS